MREIYLRIDDANPNMDKRRNSVTAVRISNELFGSDTVSSFQLAKFAIPIDNLFMPETIPRSIINTYAELQARRKLTLMLRSNATAAPTVLAGDLVKYYSCLKYRKRVKWSSPRPLLNIDTKCGIATVPGNNGNPISVAVEDIRAAVSVEEFDVHVSENDDQLSTVIEFTLENDDMESDHLGDTETDNAEVITINFSPDYDMSVATVSETPSVDDKIEILWPIDDKFYPGIVSDITESGLHVISYDDGDTKTLRIFDETWRPNAAILEFYTSVSLKSNEVEVLQHMLSVIGMNPFMFHRAQGFPQYVIFNAYRAEEYEFKKHVPMVPIDDVPTDASIISSHTVYKIKVDED